MTYLSEPQPEVQPPFSNSRRFDFVPLPSTNRRSGGDTTDHPKYAFLLGKSSHPPTRHPRVPPWAWLAAVASHVVVVAAETGGGEEVPALARQMRRSPGWDGAEVAER